MAVIHRLYSEKLGASSVTTFVGNHGEIFYDPASLTLRISDGSTPGGRLMVGGGGSSNTSASDVTYTPGANTSIPGATNLQGAIDALDAGKLNLSGGTMSGELILDGVAPTDANSAIPAWYMEQYVSDFVANGNITSNTIVFDNTGTTLVANNLQDAIVELDATKMDLSGGDMTGPITTNQTVFANNELVSRSFVETYLASSDTYIDSAAFNVGTGVIDLVNTDGNVVSISLDGRYLPLGGGTMTGPLILDGSTSADGNAAVTQNFMETFVSNTIINGGVTSNTVVFNNANTTLTANTVQEAIVELETNKVDKAGDTMTGFLELNADPTANLHAATKQYVDSTVANTIANGGVSSNTVVFNNSNTTIVANTVQEAIEVISANVDTLEATVANLHINDLVDVNTAPVSGDILTWDGAEWINTPFATISANSSNILEHADVAATALAADQFLTYNGTSWTNATAPISQLSDVDATGVTNGQVLSWDGTNFVPFSLPPGTVDTFTSMGVTDANGLITFTKNDTSTYTVDISPYGVKVANDLGDVDTTGVSNGQVLSWDGTNFIPFSLPPGTTDTFTASGAIDGNTGVITFTKNDSATYQVDVSPYTASVPDGTAEAQQLYWLGGEWVATMAAPYVTLPYNPDEASMNAEYVGLGVTMDASAGPRRWWNTTDNTLNVWNGTAWQVINGIDAISDLTDVDTTGALATQALIFDGTEWKPKSLQLNDLTDASTAGAVSGEVLTFNGTVFAPAALPADTRLLAASFNTSDGDFQLNMSTGTNLTVNLDGRYVEKVNGIAPNANGEVTVSFTATETGTLATRPATANDGLIYVVSGDANTSLNGDAYIWSGNTASGSWVEIAPGDQATNDARYVLGGGDTMTGPLILSSDPTNVLGATTKQYVDGLVATSSVYANTVQFDTTTGQFDVILSNNHTFGTSLDGRWVKLAGDTMTGALTLPADPTANLEAATKQYVDAQVLAASTDTFVSSGVANSTSLTLTRNDGNTVVVDMSALEDVRVASGALAANTLTLTMNDASTVDIDLSDLAEDVFVASGAVSGNTLTLTMNDASTVAIDVSNLSDKHVVSGALVANTITLTMSDATTVAIGVGDIDTRIAQAKLVTGSFNTSTGQLSGTYGNGGNFVIADLDGRYVQTVNGVQADSNGNVAVALTETNVGTLAGRPTTANAGVVYIVASDPDANNDGRTFIYDDDTTAWYEVATSDTGANDARYVNTAGDTMNGTLTLAADPTSALEAATKQYVDNNQKFVNAAAFTAASGDLTLTLNDSSTVAANLDGRFVKLAGDTMTGPLVLSADPTADLEATTKQYVDDNLFNVTLAVSSPSSNNNSGDLFFDTTVGAESLYIWDGTQWLNTAGAGAAATGDVVGPASSTNDAIARFDGTTGKLLQDSPANLTDGGYLTTAGLISTEFTRNQGYHLQDFVSSSTATIDVRTKAYHKLTIGTAQTVAFTNTTLGAGSVLSFTLEIVMGGSGSLNWPANVKWAGGTAPTLTPGKTHVVMLSTSDSSTTWLASAITDFA